MRELELRSGVGVPLIMNASLKGSVLMMLIEEIAQSVEHIDFPAR